MVHRFPEKTGAGHRGDAHLLRHVDAELFIGQSATIENRARPGKRTARAVAEFRNVD